MKLEQKQGFRVSEDGAYYINIESEDILERMRKKNISLSKKSKKLRNLHQSGTCHCILYCLPSWGIDI
ncbi:hypothetical protein HJ090_11375 [Vibrio parahaemolyticus]|nr:hypothetical protein [Vibrio parahaemolyticus]